MKKIFTLMVAVGMVTLASAQQGQKNTSFKDTKKEVKQIGTQPFQQPSFEKSKAYGYDMYSFSLKEKNAQIQKINREYDQKIAVVKKNWRMRPQEKSKQIRMLENQRNQEIKQVQSRWENDNNRGNDRGQHKDNSRH